MLIHIVTSIVYRHLSTIQRLSLIEKKAKHFRILRKKVSHLGRAIAKIRNDCLSMDVSNWLKTEGKDELIRSSCSSRTVDQITVGNQITC